MNERTLDSGKERASAGLAQDFLPLVYEDLRKLASQRMAHMPPGQTLQPTALVHEVWLRLVTAEGRTWQNRAHFFAAAAEMMRHILVDHLRRKTRVKRGGGQQRVDVDQIELADVTPDDKVLLINDVLERLQAEDPEKAALVVLKFFGGLTDQEAALSLGVTERTIERRWAYAKAWLLRAIKEEN